MKNILLLTSIYPADDLPKEYTPVVHYFAKEWIKLGHNVVVIHNMKYYPIIFHWLIKLLKRIISKNYDYPFPLRQYSKTKSYSLDNVPVYRIPIYKKFPQARIAWKTVRKQFNKIQDLVDSIEFSPDVVIGHWSEPQIFLVKELGSKYGSKTCIVMHNDVEDISKIFGKETNNIIDSIDVWGFRSGRIKFRFESLYGSVNNSFLCYSGIPVNKMNPMNRKFDNGLKKFIFVGLLIPRKHPTALVKAIKDFSMQKDFHISYIGEGPEKDNILSLANEFNITNNISVLGRLPRENVFEKLKEADCFIMLSKPETMGLVYLEAMSMGCITIGSKNEGIDGIIKHGENGFLCNPGDHQELSNLLTEIETLSKQELMEISKNAMRTASELTDRKVAAHYIDSIVKN